MVWPMEMELPGCSTTKNFSVLPEELPQPEKALWRPEVVPVKGLVIPERLPCCFVGDLVAIVGTRVGLCVTAGTVGAVVVGAFVRSFTPQSAPECPATHAQRKSPHVRPVDEPACSKRCPVAAVHVPAAIQRGTRVLVSLWDSLMFGRVLKSTTIF